MNCLLCCAPAEVFFEKNEPSLGFKRYRKCPQCTLIFLEPEFYLPIDQEHKRYQTHNNSPNDPKYRAFLSQLTDPLFKLLNKEDVGLDFGCGPGPTVSAMLGEKGFDVINYDPCFFSDVPLLNTTYDFITCTEVVEHFHDPKTEFTLLKTLLKPKRGYLAVMTQVLEDDNQFDGWWYHRDPTHVCFYSHQTFEWIASAHNWKINYSAPNVVIFSNT